MAESETKAAIKVATKRAAEVWKSLIVCGGSAADRLRGIQCVLDELPDGLFAIAIGPESLTAWDPSKRMSPDADDGRTIGTLLRAALRMDPDAIVVSEPAPEHDPMLSQVAETGHLLVISAEGAIDEAFQRLQDSLMPTMGEFLGAERLAEHLRRTFAIQVELGPDFTVAASVLPEPPAPRAEVAEEQERTLHCPIEPGEEPIAESLLAMLKRHTAARRRSCFVPRFGEGGGAPEASKFGGAGMLAPGEAWPKGGSTGCPMQLVFQLRIDELPGTLRDLLGAETGWWQFFYDPSSSGEGEPWAPFSDYQLLRVLPADGAVPAGEAPAPDSVEDYSERAVLGWQELPDAPHDQDDEDLPDAVEEPLDVLRDTLIWMPPNRRLVFGEGEASERAREALQPMLDWMRLESIDELKEAVELVWCRSGDKLLGWPYWSQGNETPTCPKSGEPMRFLAQISANRNEEQDPEPGEGCHFPMLFAADGTGQILQSPVDPSVMTFVWACG